MFDFNLDLIKDIQIRSFIFGFFCVFLGILAITIPQPIAAILCIIGLVYSFDKRYIYEENYSAFLVGWSVGFLFSLIYVVALNVSIVFIPSQYFLCSSFLTGYVFYFLRLNFPYKNLVLCLIGSIGQTLSFSTLLFLSIFNIINAFTLFTSIFFIELGYFFAYLWFSS